MTAEQALGPFNSFADLLAAIEVFDPIAEEQLYTLFDGIFRFQLTGQIEPEYLLDALHAAFLDVLIAVRRGDIRNPGSLISFCHTVTHRKYARHVDDRVTARRSGATPLAAVQQSTLEADHLLREQQALLRRGLAELCPRDREILTRFYLDEESQQAICEAMHLSETQFRVIKSRAKAKLRENVLRLNRAHLAPPRRTAFVSAEDIAA